MKDIFKSIKIAQINPIVGDIEYNKNKIIEIAKANANTGLIIFPELAICGYPPKDLILRRHFIDECYNSLYDIAETTQNSGNTLIVGCPHRVINKIHNFAFLIKDGKFKVIAGKQDLPTYGVFEEKRRFKPSKASRLFEHEGVKFGVAICEDIWSKKRCKNLKLQGAEAIISINASPYREGIENKRLSVATKRVKETNLPLIYCNTVGGQDGIVFDGGSFSLDANANKIGQLPQFAETTEPANQITKKTTNNLMQAKHEAILLGLKDYFAKNGFKKALLGLSGGVDSALTAVLACQALGAENVALYALPSRYSSQNSFNDADKLAKNLNIELKQLSIEPSFTAILQTLQPEFANHKPDSTEENIQSRIRGLLLMAISNKKGSLLLTTGNKSEIAVGYSTLYGDSCGAFNPIKDLYKTEVYKLCEHINKGNEIIPQNILTKAPTAELRDNQKDSDSLPDYHLLDAVLKGLIEQAKSPEEIAEEIEEFSLEDVLKISRMLFNAEYKRQQSAIGVKLSSTCFDDDWKMPITNGYKK